MKLGNLSILSGLILFWLGQTSRGAFITHRQLQLHMRPSSTSLHNAIRSLPNEDESWFVKTEQFCKPFPQVKPHLEAHRAWVAVLREEGYCITSGYRVDSEGKPGGGGLMFLAAKTYAEAEALVLLDPLVANGCVDWKLNGWMPEVGDIELR